MRVLSISLCSLALSLASPMASNEASAMTIGDSDAAERSSAGAFVWLEYGGRSLSAAAVGEDDAQAGLSEAVGRAGKSKVDVPAMKLGADEGDPTKFKAAVMQLVRAHFKGINISFSEEHPGRDDHHLVVIGGKKEDLVGAADLGFDWGPIDCGNANKRNVGYVFTETLAARDGRLDKAKLAATVAQVTGHMMGLEHVDGDQTLIMTAVPNNTSTYRFSDSCVPLLVPDDDNTCTDRTCAPGQQNSRAYLEQVLGTKDVGGTTGSTTTTATTMDPSATSNSDDADTTDQTMTDSSGETDCTADCGCRLAGLSSDDGPAAWAWLTLLGVLGIGQRRGRKRR